MKMLVVFLLPVLGWSPTEGTHVSKCELWGHLKNATCSPPMKNRLHVPNVDNLLAKIVCNTEVATGFDTCAVKELMPGTPDHGSNSGHNLPKHRGRRSHRPASLHPPSDKRGTLHGIFQLAGHLVCNDGVTPSANICGMPCSNLQDGNIQDDIQCLLDVTTTLGDSLFGAKTWEVQGGQMKQVMEKRCENVQALTYFSTCG